MVTDLIAYQSDCVDAFRMECSKEDLKKNKEARKLAKFINKQGKKIDRIEMLRKNI